MPIQPQTEVGIYTPKQSINSSSLNSGSWDEEAPGYTRDKVGTGDFLLLSPLQDAPSNNVEMGKASDYTTL